jgi:hypothetical protein
LPRFEVGPQKLNDKHVQEEHVTLENKQGLEDVPLPGEITSSKDIPLPPQQKENVILCFYFTPEAAVVHKNMTYCFFGCRDGTK